MADPRVTGALRYSQDVSAEGMFHARLVRSPHAHARILRVDAPALPEGVVALLPEDVRDLGSYGPQIKDQQVLPQERVRYAGDVVAAVAAETPEEAAEAVGLIDIEYEELPAVFDEVEAASKEALLVHEDISISENDAAYFGIRPQRGTNVCHLFRLRHGDVEAGFEEAEVIVEETYRTAGANHAAMEPHAALARWVGDRLEVVTGTQTPFNMRSDLAALFGMDEERVRIVSPPMGGAFGAKTFVRVEAIAACLARKAGRPVKLVLGREEEWMTLNRHPATIRIRLGARNDGTLIAAEIECWANTGAYADCGPGVAQKMGFAAPGPYRIPHVKVDSRCIYTNLPPAGAFRGYGQMQCTWARERTIDLLADRLGMDPLDLRLKNLLRDGDTYCTGERMHDVHFEELLLRAADAVDWSKGRRNKGLCVMLKGMQTPSRASIVVERDGDETYTVRCATAEMGQGAKAAIRKLAAELLGVGVERVSFPDPDTDLVPYDTRTTSSRSTHMMGRALEIAVADLKENGVRGYGEVMDEGGLDPDTGQGIASSHWHQGAAAAEVEVDEETGRFRVVRLHAPVYAGRVVDRPAAELQNEGSMIMGLGTALFESNEFTGGQISNPNLSDYNLPAMDDMPEALSHDLLEREGAGIHGLGETALPPVPPAIGNALYSRGIHVRDLPISAESVLDAIEARDSTPAPVSDARAGASSDGRPSRVLLATLGAGLLALALYRLLKRRRVREVI
ncbi:aldehyde oxidase [Rubrobacter xylanophilus]|uniref:Aldehyde oxidase n=1 Tax=Rubrobacter xylanophilus TaxID=49319 RepID=A0A510HLQ4_9ACTN|nr:xanthine dehydrogenase family protein molybdopterin-binding subunit [Rubrobacter xylanophilus]BBL80892.1 aldehyde oxidase [Rubrobacter xylanophilus]